MSAEAHTAQPGPQRGRGGNADTGLWVARGPGSLQRMPLRDPGPQHSGFSCGQGPHSAPQCGRRPGPRIICSQHQWCLLSEPQARGQHRHSTAGQDGSKARPARSAQNEARSRHTENTQLTNQSVLEKKMSGPTSKAQHFPYCHINLR